MLFDDASHAAIISVQQLQLYWTQCTSVSFILLFTLCMQGLKPEKKTDANGKLVEDYWPTAKKVLLHFNFIVCVIKATTIALHFFIPIR